MRMTSATRTLLLIPSIVFFLASCQKEVDFQNLNNPGNPGGGGTGNNNITGDWNFVGMIAHTLSTVTVAAGGEQLKTVTVSDYITKDNVGTVKITSGQFISTGLAYSIDTMMNVKTYVNGILLDELDLPFIMSAPVTSSTSDYTRNNNDSLTFASAFAGPSDPSAGGAVPTGPVGARISWTGDTLLLKVVSSYTRTMDAGGTPATITGALDGTMKLKRR